MIRQQRRGFTLLEVLLVVAAIAILAGIVIVAVNPSKQLADTRNVQRKTDVNTILNAIYQYSIDNSGALPGSIPVATDCAGTSTADICRTDNTSCDKVDLSDLTANATYVSAIPRDPSSTDASYVGYRVVRDSSSRVTVCAPGAERSQTISVTR